MPSVFWRAEGRGQCNGLTRTISAWCTWLWKTAWCRWGSERFDFLGSRFTVERYQRGFGSFYSKSFTSDMLNSGEAKPRQRSELIRNDVAANQKPGCSLKCFEHRWKRIVMCRVRSVLFFCLYLLFIFLSCFIHSVRLGFCGSVVREARLESKNTVCCWGLEPIGLLPQTSK